MTTETQDLTTTEPTETTKRAKRQTLDYRVFEVQFEEAESPDDEPRMVLVETVTPVTEKSGSQAVIRALKARIKSGDDRYNGKTIVVAGLSDLLTVKVENKRVVSFG